MSSTPLSRAARRLPAAALIVAAYGLLCPAPMHGQKPTRLVLGTYGDAVEADVGGAVLTEAYRRLGITLEIQHFAGDLSIDRSQSGAVDGEVERVDGIEERYPTLVQVRVPVAYTDIAVYSRDSTLRVRDWRDLASLRVATVRGLNSLERSSGDLHVRFVDTFAELYPLLLRGEVDAIITSDLGSQVMLGTRHPGVYRNSIIASFMLYHYLNRRHVDLVPEVERTLKDMLTDGTVARIRAARVAQLSAVAGRRR